MKKIFTAIALAASLVLVGCGQRVEVPPAHMGKVMGSSGYKEQMHSTSRFRLDSCWFPGSTCDKLVLINSGDFAVKEAMELLMPKDKLKMSFTLQTTLTVNPKKYDEIFSRVAPVKMEDDVWGVNANTVYQTYAQQIIRSEAREYLSRFEIGEIVSNLDKINAELQRVLTKSISEKTPFIPRFVGLSDVKYPDVIANAQVNAAKRREDIAQEEASLEVSKVSLEREFQEQKLKRKTEVEKANSEAQVNKILADSMTPAYIKYREMQALDAMAASDNKVFIPVGALNSMAVQRQIGQ